MVGHIVDMTLLQPEFLSVLRAAYDFISTNYKKRVKLGPSVAKEMRQVQALVLRCAVLICDCNGRPRLPLLTLH
eukprot:7882983-Karenia_brevis.AAC.1